MNIVALHHFLEPFQPFLTAPNVSEVCVNRAGEVWVDQAGTFTRYDVPQLTLAYLWQFASLVAEHNQRALSAEAPILSAVLPSGARVQFVVEPACEKGSFICSIREPSVATVPLERYFVNEARSAQDYALGAASLAEVYRTKNYSNFLTLAVQAKKNIVISGGTSTGKTTFLNSLLAQVPLTERIITIESDREVRSLHQNSVHLLAAQDGKSVAPVTMLDLLKASLRLRPDRLMVSELRAEEAFPYLRAINSGHPGSMTTLHADSPTGCFDQLAFMVMQGGHRLSRSEIITYAKSIIDIVVQLKRTVDGRRYVSDVYFKDACQPTSLVAPMSERKRAAS